MAVKILSVDDSKMIHAVIAKALKPFNVELFFASNGVEGLAIANREKPNLIILDVTMPVMDGVEALSKLKADPLLKDIPVIMLTAEAGKENVIKIARIGIRDYIIKPFTEQLIVERISRVIDLQPKGLNEVKVKTLDDSVSLLVVEDRPAIIETIREGTQSYNWKVTGISNCGEAIDFTAKEIPDAILISLSLPDKAAFNFFHSIRANANTKSLPIFGLSVKTATDEQNQAQSIGFTGFFTKPLDLADLCYRLCRAMNLDTSKRYFSVEGSALYVKLPNQPSALTSTEFTSYCQPKLRDMVDSGLSKLVIDAVDVIKIDMPVIKLMLSVVQQANELGVKFRVIGSSDFGVQMKTFEEIKDLKIYGDRETALASF